MKEYKIVYGDVEYCQKVLNQWKHKYVLEIIQMCAIKFEQVFILLTREEKK